MSTKRLTLEEKIKIVQEAEQFGYTWGIKTIPLAFL